MTRNSPKIYFSLSWFDKQSEELVGEIPLDIDAHEIRRALRLPPKTSLTDSFPITRQHLPALKKFLSHPIHLQKFDYFIETSNAPMPAPEGALR